MNPRRNSNHAIHSLHLLSQSRNLLPHLSHLSGSCGNMTAIHVYVFLTVSQEYCRATQLLWLHFQVHVSPQPFFLETSPKLGLLWTSVSVTRVCSMSVLPLLPFCKRAQVREQLAVKYDHLFQEFPDLRSLLPNPADHTCKRTWERACFRCRELCRLALGVEERGERASCHNFVLKVFEQTLELNPELRSHLPDPANDSLTDREWLGMAIAAYLTLLSCDELRFQRA